MMSIEQYLKQRNFTRVQNGRLPRIIRGIAAVLASTRLERH